MPELTAIKVKIGLRPNGQADHPDFNQLPTVKAAGVDWSHWVDVHGIGWHYDKQCGHDDNEPDSPAGMQWGMLVVPEACAAEAVAMFPDRISRMTEAECQAFYDERAHAHETEDVRDKDVLQAIESEERIVDDVLRASPDDKKMKARKAALATSKAKALDPDDPTPGIRKNHNKLWADMKVRRGITFKEA